MDEEIHKLAQKKLALDAAVMESVNVSSKASAGSREKSQMGQLLMQLFQGSVAPQAPSSPSAQPPDGGPAGPLPSSPPGSASKGPQQSSPGVRDTPVGSSKDCESPPVSFKRGVRSVMSSPENTGQGRQHGEAGRSPREMQWKFPSVTPDGGDSGGLEACGNDDDGVGVVVTVEEQLQDIAKKKSNSMQRLRRVAPPATACEREGRVTRSRSASVLQGEES